MDTRALSPILVSLQSTHRGLQREVFRQKGYSEVTPDLQRRCLGYVGDRLKFVRACEELGWLPKGVVALAKEQVGASESAYLERACLDAFFRNAKQHFVLHGVDLQSGAVTLACLAASENAAHEQFISLYPLSRVNFCHKVDESRFIHDLDLDRVVGSAVLTKPNAEIMTKDGRYLSVAAYGNHIGLSERAVLYLQRANGHIDVAMRSLERQLSVAVDRHGRAVFGGLLGELRQAVSDGGLQQGRVVWRERGCGVGAVMSGVSGLVNVGQGAVVAMP